MAVKTALASHRPTVMSNRPLSSTLQYYLIAAQPAQGGQQEKRRDSSSGFIQSDSDADASMPRMMGRRNSSNTVRYSATTTTLGVPSAKLYAGRRRNSTLTSATAGAGAANNNNSTINYATLSLNDLSPPPRAGQPLHLIASMSPQAQYCMLRAYEQLIRDELLMLRVEHHSGPADSSGGSLAADLSSLSTNQYGGGVQHLNTPARAIDEEAAAAGEFFREAASSLAAADRETIELRNIKLSHFMEIAVKILNIIRTNRRLEAKKNDPNYVRYHHLSLL